MSLSPVINTFSGRPPNIHEGEQFRKIFRNHVTIWIVSNVMCSIGNIYTVDGKDDAPEGPAVSLSGQREIPGMGGLEWR